MNIQDIPDDDTGQAIKRWAVDGSNLSKPMKIDFFVDVPNESMGAKLADDSAMADFNVSFEQDDETGRWTCYCSRTIIPDYLTIMQIETQLADVAKRIGAKYDGFGSFGNVPSADVPPADVPSADKPSGSKSPNR